MDGKYVVCGLNSIMLNALNKIDKAEREASLFSILCTIKMKFPDEFEVALIAFLRHGTEAINECKRRSDNAED